MGDGEDRAAEIKTQLAALEALLGIEAGEPGDRVAQGAGETRLEALMKASEDLDDTAAWVNLRAEALRVATQRVAAQRAAQRAEGEEE